MIVASPARCTVERRDTRTRERRQLFCGFWALRVTVAFSSCQQLSTQLSTQSRAGCRREEKRPGRYARSCCEEIESGHVPGKRLGLRVWGFLAPPCLGLLLRHHLVLLPILLLSFFVALVRARLKVCTVALQGPASTSNKPAEEDTEEAHCRPDDQDMLWPASP